MNPIEIVSLNFLILTGLALLVYYFLPPQHQTGWLVAVSYFFYFTWNWRYPVILLALTLINFVLGRQIQRTKSRALFLVGILMNAGAFVSMKFLAGPYGTTLLDRLQAGEFTVILLPIGFSFYILQILSYLIDIYRDQIKAEDNFVHFALYLAYFPKLLAGPIERAKNFLPQLNQKRLVDKGSVEQGMYLILLGLLRKIVIADHLLILRPVDIFSSPENYTSLERVLWLLIFAFTLYNDFAGYTSIMRGVSCLFGIELSPNFRQPFLAKSFSDFWSRWHITLSDWLRDYVFFPLRRSLMFIQWNRWMALLVPPLLTMLASGLWHGAYLAILVWGFAHGFFLIFEQVLQQYKFFPKTGWLAHVYRGFVFTAVTVAWIPFNAPSVRSAGRYLTALLPPYSASFNLYVLPDITLLIFLSFWLDLQEQRHGDLAFPRKLQAQTQTWVTAIAIILILLFLNTGNDLSGFIYQGF